MRLKRFQPYRFHPKLQLELVAGMQQFQLNTFTASHLLDDMRGKEIFAKRFSRLPAQGRVC